MEKINRNLDKIKNMFTQPETFIGTYPKSTKNQSSAVMKQSDLLNTINSYTTFIKTGKADGQPG